MSESPTKKARIFNVDAVTLSPEEVIKVEQRMKELLEERAREKIREERDYYKEKYERLIAEQEYDNKRDNITYSDKTTSEYVSNGGEAWDIVPQEYWFNYNTCKNPNCQEEGMDWYGQKFYCNDDCEKEAGPVCEEILKTCDYKP